MNAFQLDFQFEISVVEAKLQNDTTFIQGSIMHINNKKFILLFYAITSMYVYSNPLWIIIPVRTIIGFQ